ncbi:hypothetical protein MASR2M39_28580 [Ignavibacteriales bacterium]
MGLKELRKRANLKSAQVAEKLGLTQGHYSHIELGRRSIREEFIPILSEILFVSEDTIKNIRDKRQQESRSLKSWISQVTIGEDTLINQIINELRYGQRFNIDDINGFPYFMANFIADKIREELKIEFKNDGKFREYLKRKLDEIE